MRDCSSYKYTLPTPLHAVIPLHNAGVALYGSRQPNGTYSNYLGILQRGAVDMIVGDFTVTKERLEDFELLVTPMYASSKVMTKYKVLQRGEHVFCTAGVYITCTRRLRQYAFSHVRM